MTFKAKREVIGVFIEKLFIFLVDFLSVNQLFVDIAQKKFINSLAVKYYSNTFALPLSKKRRIDFPRSS